MLNKIMTDAEIIEALRLKIETDEKMEEVYLLPNGMLSKLDKAILDLINRQQAEIERLNNIKFGVDLSIGSIKAEAIKEFITKHREMMLLFCDDDDQISLKVCEYDVNTNSILKKEVGE